MIRSSSDQPTDRGIGFLLLAFFLSLYLLTGGGHGYSPDGEFAFRMARSVILDPTHDYFNRMKHGLNQWGFVVPTLAQPLVLLTDPLVKAMPQKDYVTVDGRTFVLGIFRKPGLLEEAPTVGLIGGGPEEYVRQDLPATPSTSLAVVSHLSLSSNVEQGAMIAEITLKDGTGSEMTLPLRAGIETAEWSLGKRNSQARHGMARVASIWSGDTGGRSYYADLPFGRTFAPTELRIRYLQVEGNLYVRSLLLLDQETNSFRLIPSEFRMWSERENDDLWARVFYSPYNAIITSFGCVLLFALARLLRYSQRVSLVATLVYGLATLAWPYSKFDFSEPTLTLIILANLYLILRWDRSRRDLLLIAAGLVALLAVATKYAAGVLVPFMLLQIALLQWRAQPSSGQLRQVVRPMALFSAPFLAISIPIVLYLSRSFGYLPHILDAWEGLQNGWLPLPFWIGFQGLLISPGRSFFLYSPPMVLALVSLVPFVRRHGLRSVALLTIAIVYFTLYSMKVVWHAGAGWGPRYQVVVIPLLILVAAPLIQKAIDERNRWARAALMATFVLGVGVQLLGISKNFDTYLGMFRYQIVDQLPDRGASYGGADYYPYAAGLDDHNSITATVQAWPFSPILAHAWLVSADILSVGPSFLQAAKDRVLATPPWELWGVRAVPEHPEYGLGLDLWSLRLWNNFPSFTALLAAIFLLLLALEAVLVTSGAGLLSICFKPSRRRRGTIVTWIAASIVLFLVFDGMHFLV